MILRKALKSIAAAIVLAGLTGIIKTRGEEAPQRGPFQYVLSSINLAP